MGKAKAVKVTLNKHSLAALRDIEAQTQGEQDRLNRELDAIITNSRKLVALVVSANLPDDLDPARAERVEVDMEAGIASVTMGDKPVE